MAEPTQLLLAIAALREAFAAQHGDIGLYNRRASGRPLAYELYWRNTLGQVGYMGSVPFEHALAFTAAILEELAELRKGACACKKPATVVLPRLERSLRAS